MLMYIVTAVVAYSSIGLVTAVCTLRAMSPCVCPISSRRALSISIVFDALTFCQCVLF